MTRLRFWRKPQPPPPRPANVLTVHATRHAVERARERVDEEYTPQRVLAEFCSAWTQGRFGPQITHPDFYYPTDPPANVAWSEDGKIGFVAERNSKGHWIVVTVVTTRPRRVREGQLEALKRRFS